MLLVASPVKYDFGPGDKLSASHFLLPITIILSPFAFCP